MGPEKPPVDDVLAARSGLSGMVERHRVAAVLISTLLLVGAGSGLTWFYWPQPDLSPPTRAWYSVDDGATWFEDDAERIPPFEHDGRPAVRLHLFSCDGGKTTFAGYLQKLPEEAFEKYREQGIDPATVDDDDLAAESGWLYKRPGPAEWVNSLGPKQQVEDVVSVRCPDGRAGRPVEVFPKNPRKR